MNLDINLEEINAVDIPSKMFFQEQGSVLLFKAVWCPNCQEFTPLYKKFALNHPEIKFYIIDIDFNMDAYAEYELSSIPSFIYIPKKSDKAITYSGKKSLEEFKKFLINSN